MMKKLLFLLPICLTVFIVSSCSENEPDVGFPTSASVKFDASVEKFISRASGTTWDATDAIGVYMKAAGGDLATTAISGAENIKYTTVGGSNVSFAGAAAGIELPADGSNVDFIAYYPYLSAINAYEYGVNVTSQNPQKDIDLLYSNNAVNTNKNTQGNIGLNFTHELAKIVINVTAGSGVSNLNGLVVKVTGITPTATFALKDGTLTPTGDAADITLLLNGNVAEGIVVPGTTGERVFVFELNGKAFKYVVPETVIFTKGHKYTYDATLALEGVTLFNPDGSITDWTDSPQGTITPGVDGGGGTDPTPGTRTEFFKEVFGDGNTYGSGSRPKIAAMDNWSMTSPITYTDQYGLADIRSTGTVSPSVWFPSTSASVKAISELVIGGLDQLGAYTDIKLSYDIAANTAATGNVAHLEVFCATTPGGFTALTAVEGTFSVNNEFISITDIQLENGISELKFYYDANNGGAGYRLDNVILTGVAP